MNLEVIAKNIFATIALKLKYTKIQKLYAIQVDRSRVVKRAVNEGQKGKWILGLSINLFTSYSLELGVVSSFSKNFCHRSTINVYVLTISYFWAYALRY